MASSLAPRFLNERKTNVSHRGTVLTETLTRQLWILPFLESAVPGPFGTCVCSVRACSSGKPDRTPSLYPLFRTARLTFEGAVWQSSEKRWLGNGSSRTPRE